MEITMQTLYQSIKEKEFIEMHDKLKKSATDWSEEEPQEEEETRAKVRDTSA